MANPWLGMLNQEGHPIRELAMAFMQPQAPGSHGDHHEHDPFGPTGPPPGFGARGGFGWSSFDGPQDHGSWHHDFTHRPHPGRRGGRHDYRGRHHPRHEPQDEQEGHDVADTDMPEASDRGDATGGAAMTPATEDTITLEDNDRHATRDFPDPEISTPGVEDNQQEFTSGSDTEPQQHSGENGYHRCHHRGGSRGRRHDRHSAHEHWSGRGGWGGRGGRGGMHGHRHPFGGPRHSGIFPGGGHPRHGHWGRGGRWPGPPPPAFGMGQWQNLWTNWAQAVGRGERQRGFQEFLQHILSDVGVMINPDTSDQNAANRSCATNSANEPSSEAVAGSNTMANHPDLDFRPAADIYDMPEEYVVHLILPGAKKEDVSLGWDADACELQVAGVIARDGNEHVLQALALAEREVGIFERRVKLGLDKVDAEGIAARMENGILIVNVPKKKEEEQWTEVRKVDIL